ncbi:iron complex transport system ATP-binding protein [Anaerovirgula multivorans]|uniref:Iron complex transport system ATP-binding protein n=1 Tax=Anaerovirgula multivorans TaxID=312168 RepID=A0A239G7Y0_9FIRM|nr:ABC transporter ATP-binding protein [Anaerovirgula multivorans]SNS65267.1 iron complex transport system ATP-binding protein [Anaerovirgula multivorans]
MLLQVENGSYSYTKENPVLQGINFSLQEGEILAVMGPNGIGKTTLLKCLMGILKWQSGHSLIDGQDSGMERKKIGYVPQAHRFSFSYSVRDMVVFGRAKYMSLLVSPGKEDYKIADAALEEVGIVHLRDKSVSRLSGGQLQLVLIARALAGQPCLLILDEPESHLDFSNQFTILQIIKRLAKEKGIACVMNTHYPDHAIRFADHILLLKGERYLVGRPRDVLSKENVREYFKMESSMERVFIDGREIDLFVLLDKI